jgi:RHS repeat-associated protein
MTRYDSYTESGGGGGPGGRWYDPLIGRFINADSIVPRPGDPQALNRYSYARSNPMTRVDPNGHADEDPQKKSVCQILPMICSPQSPPLENEMGESLSVEQRPIVLPNGQAVTIYAAKGEGENKSKGGGLIGRILGGLGSAITGLLSRFNPSVWRLDQFERGRVIEDRLGQNLPESFPVIDRFANGIATSIKSINLADQSYQSVSRLSSVVRGYVNDLARFQGANFAGYVIRPSMIQSRELVLAIPPGASQAQLNALSQLQRWATTIGVALKIVTVK